MNIGDKWKETDARKKVASFLIIAVSIGLVMRLPRFVPGWMKIGIAAAALALFAALMLYGFFKGRKKETRKRTLKVIKGGMAHIPKPRKPDIASALGKRKKGGRK